MFSFSVLSSFHPAFLRRFSTSALLIPCLMSVRIQSSGVSNVCWLLSPMVFLEAQNFQKGTFLSSSGPGYTPEAVDFRRPPSRYVEMYRTRLVYSSPVSLSLGRGLRLFSFSGSPSSRDSVWVCRPVLPSTLLPLKLFVLKVTIVDGSCVTTAVKRKGSEKRESTG